MNNRIKLPLTSANIFYESVVLVMEFIIVTFQLYCGIPLSSVNAVFPLAGDLGFEELRLRLVLSNPAIIPEHHHVQEIQYVQV